MSEIIDYAMPMMRIEMLMKKMHNALLENRLPEAQEIAIEVVSESRFLINTLILMQEKQNALRHQVKTVQEGIPAAAESGRTRKSDGPPAGKALNGRQRH